MSLLTDWEAYGNSPGQDDIFFAGDPSLRDAYVHVGIDYSSPLFGLERLERIPGVGPGTLITGTISNRVLLVAVFGPARESRICRVHLNTKQCEEMEIPRRADDRVSKIFVDPLGQHSLIVLTSGDTYYVHSTWRKVKLLSKLKGLMITAVGWNAEHGTEWSSGAMLLGTDTGALFEISLDSKDRDKNALKSCSQVHQLNPPGPITALHFDSFPVSDSPRFLVMLTTPSRLFQFVGGPTFDSLFQQYVGESNFMTVGRDMEASALEWYSKTHGRAECFAWLTSEGIVTGNLLFTTQTQRESCVANRALIPYPNQTPPLSLAITEYHLLLLYEDKLVAINRVSEAQVFDESLQSPVFGRPLHLHRDSKKQALWLFSDTNIFHIVATDEDRHMWQLYLARKQFNEALQLCKTAAQKDTVRCAQADQYFEERKFEAAATIYAKTSRSFEDVTLRFDQLTDKEPLKVYLVNKVDNIASEDRMQVTMICTWLTEIYLGNLNELQGCGAGSDFAAMQAEFKSFLIDHHKSMLPAVTYDLLLSHGRIDEYMFFAETVKDWDRVLNQLIVRRQYTAALKILLKQPEDHVGLFYRYSAALMYHEPVQTVDTWIRAASLVDPRNLIPALMHYTPACNPPGNTQHQGIRYLEHCVLTGNKDAAMHNLLLSYYAHQQDDTPLLNFICLNESKRFFDLDYALRVCSSLDKQRACVHIYSAMHQYEKAVELAVNIDLQLAQVNADKPVLREDRKKLWLCIARHIIQDEKDIKKAMAFLHTCDVLKIEDILPFFPNVTTIAHFQTEICESLEEYNVHIAALGEHMDRAMTTSNRIHAEIKELKNRQLAVRGDAVCRLCNEPLLSRAYYVFPCKHCFHVACLYSKVYAMSSPTDRRRLDDLVRRLFPPGQPLPSLTSPLTATATAPARPSPPASLPVASAAPWARTDSSVARSSPASSPPDVLAAVDTNALQAEFDEVVAGDCVLCGDLMVQCIDKPLVLPAEQQHELTWHI